ncbi:hypothetical protein BDN67DRAFT_1036392 [Paxillus ammoniavirescens]|nr:hypothetical protein BDN67DRAFT_1036392 [Paxillus ammoniavirescens]
MHLIKLVHHHPNWFLDELTTLMQENRFISVYYTTVHQEFGVTCGDFTLCVHFTPYLVHFLSLLTYPIQFYTSTYPRYQLG